MVLSALQTEFAARGFDYLSTTRQNYFLNEAYQVDICEAEDWMFLRSASTGVTPLTVSDLRSVESVIDTTSQAKLSPLDPRAISDYDPMFTAGSPTSYFVTYIAAPTVYVWPTSTADSVQVTYWKVPTALSAAGDTPIIPTRFHRLIVDAAVVRAYEDDDEYQAAQAADVQFQGRLQKMRESLLGGQQHDQPVELIVSMSPDTDL